MTKINKKVEYSLMALKLINQAEGERFVSAKEIADALSIPFEMVARVLQTLASRGVLDVQHGAMGGYRVSRSLKSLSFLELINIVQGPTSLAKCLSDDDCEVQKKCNIQNPIKFLNDKIDELFEGLVVGDLIMEPSLTSSRTKSI